MFIGWLQPILLGVNERLEKIFKIPVFMILAILGTQDKKSFVVIAIPHAISLARPVFAGVIWWQMDAGGSFLLILSLLVIAMLTDHLDGTFARVCGNAGSRTGRFLDPACDKVFLVIMLVILRESINPIFFWGLIALETALFCIGVYALVGEVKVTRKQVPLGANIWGKSKFALECVAVVVLFVFGGNTGIFVGNALLFLACLSATLSLQGKVSKGLAS